MEQNKHYSFKFAASDFCKLESPTLEEWKALRLLYRKGLENNPNVLEATLVGTTLTEEVHTELLRNYIECLQLFFKAAMHCLSHFDSDSIKQDIVLMVIEEWLK